MIGPPLPIGVAPAPVNLVRAAPLEVALESLERVARLVQVGAVLVLAGAAAPAQIGAAPASLVRAEDPQASLERAEDLPRVHGIHQVHGIPQVHGVQASLERVEDIQAREERAEDTQAREERAEDINVTLLAGILLAGAAPAPPPGAVQASLVRVVRLEMALESLERVALVL